MGLVFGAKGTQPPDRQSVQIQYTAIAGHMHQPVRFFLHQMFLIFYVPGEGNKSQVPFPRTSGQALSDCASEKPWSLTAGV